MGSLMVRLGGSFFFVFIGIMILSSLWGMENTNYFRGLITLDVISLIVMFVGFTLSDDEEKKK
jgi:hypothetical protein